MEQLEANFFERDPVSCARELIGCEFLWKGQRGKIVETEACAAVGDKACHTWFRPSARKFVAEHPTGAAYVYLSYVIHWLFNILVKSGMVNGDDKIAMVAGPRIGISCAKDLPWRFAAADSDSLSRKF